MLEAENARNVLDASDDVDYANELVYGINEGVVRHISASNAEPEWMLEHRLRSLAVFRDSKMPTWGPDISALDLDGICYYARPKGSGDNKSWEDVPENIKNTFDKLGIPEAEKRMLAGVGAQYDSEVVYHSLRQELADVGVIFEDMSVALRDHAEIVRKHFMRIVPPEDHVFAALHGAVWSGGTFLYIPRDVKISEPLQAYFRMNVRSGGQFEHTLIVLEDGAEAHYIEGCSAPKYGTSSLHAGCVEIFVGSGSKMRYSSVENWSTDTYNLNTKRAMLESDAHIEWVGGNLGSGVTMLYPCSVLKGDRSSASHLGVAFANAGQDTDTGAKVIHIGKDTTSRIVSKSLSKAGGRSTYRGLVHVLPSAERAVSETQCDGLVLDGESVSDAVPDIRISRSDAVVSHEATAGKINEEILFFLMSR